MSTLRTYNVQNPDSLTTNIELSANGGINVAGVITATSFVGNGSQLSGISSVSLATTAFSLSGTPNITVGNLTATGNVSIAGTLTYEDVTNVDSVGLITARNGAIIRAGTATTALIVEGNARVTGILTVGTGSILLNGNTDVITVGTGATISSSSGFLGSGTNLTALNASNLSSGTVPTARLGSGSASSSTFLRGDGSWQTPAGGAWRFISSVTASNSSSVAFTSGIDSTYDFYVITGSNIIPQTDGQGLRMRISTNGGSSYVSTDYANATGFTNVTVASGGFTDPSWEVIRTVGNGSGGGGAFILNMYYPYSTIKKMFSVMGSSSHTSDGSMRNSYYTLYNTTTSQVNAVQFFMFSGNITSGTFRLYGISNS